MDLSAWTSGFKEALEELAQREDLQDIDPKQARALGRRAARYAVAPVLWARSVGESYDTGTVSHLLGMTRQGLAYAVKHGNLIGLPGRGTTWYPAWQFDPDENEVRGVVRELLKVWAAFVEVDNYNVAAWATRPNQDLHGLSPAAWIMDGRPDGPVLQAARIAASRVAQ